MIKVLCSPLNGKKDSPSAYSLLDFAYSREYSSPLPEINKTPNGKPYFPAKRDIHFSLSHSRTHVLCALSDTPVGIDIESPRPVSERTARYFCSPDELFAFDPLDLWVLKESYIKLVGGTLLMVNRIHLRCENDAILQCMESVNNPSLYCRCLPENTKTSIDGIIPELPASSKLFRIDGCRAAVSVFSEYLPDSIELI